MPIHISEKKRGSQTFRKIWIDNLSGILDGELVKSAQRPKSTSTSIGRRHDKNTKHRNDTDLAQMFINGF